MKIKYKFVTGESNEVEVDTEPGTVLLDLEHLEFNNNRKENRRHSSLSEMNFTMA